VTPKKKSRRRQEGKNAAAYIRVGNPAELSDDRQREELLATFGDTHEIIAEYRDDASGNLGVGDRPGLKKLLEDAAKGEVDVLICTHLTRLTRRCSPEIIMAIRDAGVRVVTVDGGKIGFAVCSPIRSRTKATRRIRSG
jgi:DNA invertase Pin-like site-specific DNA recombinase